MNWEGLICGEGKLRVERRGVLDGVDVDGGSALRFLLLVVVLLGLISLGSCFVRGFGSALVGFSGWVPLDWVFFLGGMMRTLGILERSLDRHLGGASGVYV